MHKLFKHLLAFFCSSCFLAIASCTQYAQVYVNVKSGQDLSIACDIYSAKDGLYMGLSPMTIDLQKGTFENNPTLSIIAEDHKRPVAWKITEITNWARSPYEATQPAFKNEIQMNYNTETRRFSR